MSLIVLSNTQEEYDEKDWEGNIIGGRSGIERPFSFHNHLTNVMTIPPNSEVALQSLKCSRSSVANIKSSRGKQFSIYLGAELEPLVGYYHTTGMPIKVDVQPGIFSIEQLRIQLDHAIKQGFNCHPDYYNQCSVESLFVNNAFAGWEIKVNCLGQCAPVLLPNLDQTGAPVAFRNRWWLPANRYSQENPGDTTEFDGAKLIPTFVPGVGTRLTQDGNPDPNNDLDCMFQYAKAPISLMGGQFHFDPWVQADYDAHWSVGLSRPTTPREEFPFWSHDAMRPDPDEEDGLPWQSYYDYVAVWQRRSHDGKMALYLYHSSSGSGDYDDELAMNEIKYWEYNGARPVQLIPMGPGATDAQIDEENVNGNPACYQVEQMGWIVENENVSFGVSYKAGGFPAVWGLISDAQYYKEVFDDTAGPTGLYWDTAPAPLNMNKWYMYPKVGLEKNLYEIDITRYDTNTQRDVMKDEYPNDWWGDPGSAWYCRQFYGKNYKEQWMNRQIDIRQANTDLQMAQYTRKLFETTTGQSECPDYVYGVLPASDGRGLQEYTLGVYTSDGGNSQDILGFDDVYQVLNSKLGTTSNIAGNANIGADPPLPKWVLHSSQKPSFPTASTFVRLTGLTHQSYNFAKTQPSKIIYHFPRFDNAGNNVGPLFYEATEKTYLKLNNAEELQVSDLQIDIVNINEQLAIDLQGTTIVVLHIRQK